MSKYISNSVFRESIDVLGQEPTTQMVLISLIILELVEQPQVTVFQIEVQMAMDLLQIWQVHMFLDHSYQ